MKAVNSFCSDGFTSVWAVTAFSNSSQTGNEEGKGTNATPRSDCADTCNCGDSGRSPPRDGSHTSPQSRQARRPSPACGCRPCTYRASSREGSPPASCPDALGWRAPYRRKAPLTGTAILFAPVPCFVPASRDAPSSEPKNKNTPPGTSSATHTCHRREPPKDRSDGFRTSPYTHMSSPTSTRHRAPSP